MKEIRSSHLLLDPSLQLGDWQLFDENCEFVFLFLNLLSWCHQLHRSRPLAFVQLFLLAFLALELVNSLLQSRIILQRQEVVAFVEDPRRRVNLLKRCLPMLYKVAQDRVTVRVLEIQNVILLIIKLVWMQIGQIQLQSLLPAILACGFLFHSHFFINLAFFAFQSLDSFLLLLLT